MESTKEKILHFIKSEIVLSIATVLAIITCFIVPVDKEYLGYFDASTLVCLFCMLIVIAGLKSSNIFELISRKIIGMFHNRRTVIYALVFGTFLFDMIVANDMSLITFLPLTYLVLHSTKNDEYLAFTFIMQTIAANMGGMITPYGNPQNLYLYSHYHISTLEFFTILLPQAFTVAVLLYLCCAFVENKPLKLRRNSKIILHEENIYTYSFLFVLVLLSIFRIVPYFITLIVVLVAVTIRDRKRFKDVDYALIATFCVFFIFSGNIARIPAIKDFISSFVVDHTLLAGILSCQFISNVPTAIFLSNFTMNYRELLISVNIGSLGILISSLASLITLKEFLKHQPKNFWKYLGMFTVFNTGFLAVLLLITEFISLL